MIIHFKRMVEILPDRQNDNGAANTGRTQSITIKKRTVDECRNGRRVNLSHRRDFAQFTVIFTRAVAHSSATFKKFRTCALPTMYGFGLPGARLASIGRLILDRSQSV